MVKSNVVNTWLKRKRAEERQLQGRLSLKLSVSRLLHYLHVFFIRLMQSWGAARSTLGHDPSQKCFPTLTMKPSRPPKYQAFLLEEVWNPEKAVRHLLLKHKLSKVKTFAKPSRGGVAIKHKDIKALIENGEPFEFLPTSLRPPVHSSRCHCDHQGRTMR